MKKHFEVALQNESLIFSAAHFITFGDNICETLHGHNYRVACTIRGELDDHACVIDFIWLRDQLQAVRSGRWKLFLPLEKFDRHPHFKTGQGDLAITCIAVDHDAPIERRGRGHQRKTKYWFINRGIRFYTAAYGLAINHGREFDVHFTAQG